MPCLSNARVLARYSPAPQVSPFSFCSYNKPNYTARPSEIRLAFRGSLIYHRYTVWLQNRQVRSVIWHTEDARPFLLGGHAHMLFNRKLPHVLRKTMWLARLEPNYDERQLRLDDDGPERDEANWSPLPHGDELYVTYTICPHRVLRCATTNGSCTLVSNATHITCDPKMHGGSPMVSIGSRYLIGLAHRKWWSPTMQNPQYEGNDTSHASSYGMWVGYLCELLLNAIALRRAHGPTRTVTQHKHYCRLDLS